MPGKNQRPTYTINISASSLPLRVSISTIGNLCEGILDIVIYRGRMAYVDFVPISMGVRSARVSDFRTTSDDQ